MNKEQATKAFEENKYFHVGRSTTDSDNFQ